MKTLSKVMVVKVNSVVQLADGGEAEILGVFDDDKIIARDTHNGELFEITGCQIELSPSVFKLSKVGGQ